MTFLLRIYYVIFSTKEGLANSDHVINNKVMKDAVSYTAILENLFTYKDFNYKNLNSFVTFYR